VDADGRPLPWITYPAIDILGARVQRHHRVFEFGCGNSTLWWANRCESVHSVEHDEAWHRKLQAQVPLNVRLEFMALEYDGQYSKAANQGPPYDIIVVDGRDRVNCVRNAVEALTEQGVLVLDNSEREEYAAACELLVQRGFKRLPLRGLAPLVNYISETSLFYRSTNVLGL
jgi:predicted O-methyltransferase YrrM